jgi:hypothetical protein
MFNMKGKDVNTDLSVRCDDPFFFIRFIVLSVYINPLI